MTHQRRYAFLMLFSALVSPSAAFAQSAGCATGEMDIPREFGLDLTKSVIRNVFLGGAVAALAASVGLVGTVGAVGIFAGIVTYRAILPSMRRFSNTSFDAFDAGMAAFNVEN